MKIKRVIPQENEILQREFYFKCRKDIPLLDADGAAVKGLNMGNTKTGNTGSLYKTIFVWNLPPVKTCPGASQWCSSHCYNLCQESDKYPLKEWLVNWWQVENTPEVLKERINEQLSSASKPCAVRLHSSGDFYSVPYISFWKSIIELNDDIDFWGYTRSWVIKEFVGYLEGLRMLPNVNLFAAYDENMEILPPVDTWMKSIVCSELDDLLSSYSAAEYFICPEQLCLIPNCASCGFCMKKINKDIVFLLH